MADTMDVDVDPPTAAEPKGKTKEDAKGDKKRFEVKKVRLPEDCASISGSSQPFNCLGQWNAVALWAWGELH